MLEEQKFEGGISAGMMQNEFVFMDLLREERVEIFQNIRSSKQHRYDKLYLDIAKRIAEMSNAKRSKVGGVLVNNNNIISFGWNGTPTGFPNECEDENNVTLPIVVHTETNIFAKLSKNGGPSANGATLYLTLSPCYDCAKQIIQSGVKRLVYSVEYRVKEPIEFIKKAGIEVCFFQ